MMNTLMKGQFERLRFPGWMTVAVGFALLLTANFVQAQRQPMTTALVDLGVVPKSSSATEVGFNANTPPEAVAEASAEGDFIVQGLANLNSAEVNDQRIGVVDWVEVQLRIVPEGMAVPTDAPPAANSDSYSVHRKAGLLLSDGRIVNASDVETDTVPSADASLDFEGVDFNDTTHDMYIAVNHRNHIPVLSSEPASDDSGIFSYDFTSDRVKTYNGVVKESGSRYWLYGGDTNNDERLFPGDSTNVVNELLAAIEDTTYSLLLYGNANVVFRDLGVIPGDSIAVINNLVEGIEGGQAVGSPFTF